MCVFRHQAAEAQTHVCVCLQLVLKKLFYIYMRHGHAMYLQNTQESHWTLPGTFTHTCCNHPGNTCKTASMQIKQVSNQLYLGKDNTLIQIQLKRSVKMCNAKPIHSWIEYNIHSTAVACDKLLGLAKQQEPWLRGLAGRENRLRVPLLKDVPSSTL